MTVAYVTLSQLTTSGWIVLLSQVGHLYRRALTALLGIIIGEQRLRSSTRRITPAYTEQRHQLTYLQLNLVPYYAECCGLKLINLESLM